MKTSDVRSFVQEVLHSIHQPYTEHVIEDVFYAIEHRPEWMSEYKSLCEMLGKTTVNTWGGRWIAITLGKSGEKQVTSKRCSILGSYSLLDADAKPVAVKPKEEAALQLMADYYFAHKDRLPSDIRKYREQIVDLIMAGVPPAEAFAYPQRMFSSQCKDRFGPDPAGSRSIWPCSHKTSCRSHNQGLHRGKRVEGGAAELCQASVPAVVHIVLLTVDAVHDYLLHAVVRL